MYTRPQFFTMRGLVQKEREVHMPKKSPKQEALTNAIDDLQEGDIDVAMVLYTKESGERAYLHPFESEIHALEFLEIMVSSLRTDIIEKLMKRSVN